MEQRDKNKNIQNVLDTFLDEKPKKTNESEEMDCSSGVCVIKNDKSIIERVNKKIITEDGRQLLI